ncbi:MAG: putative signal transduction histidine kinase [Frankiales bacterium]|nr:putative signal transduction histidine kinase [Frankiales bacterium]
MLVGLVGAVLIGIEVAFSFKEPGNRWLLLGYPVNAASYVFVGLFAWSRRPSHQLGPILAFGGFTWLAAGLANTTDEVLIAVGYILSTLVLSVVVHLMHVFPSGRVEGRVSRATVIAAYVVGLVGQIPLYVFTAAPYPYGPLTIVNRPDLAMRGHHIQQWAGVLVVLTTTVIIGRRLRSISSRRRRVLTPLWLYGTVSVLAISFTDDILRLVDLTPTAVDATQTIILGVLPFAFLLAVRLGGFNRVGEVEELASWLGEPNQPHAVLQAAIARTLGDPSLQLVFWSDSNDAYVDVQGQATALPDPGTPRAASYIEVDGKPVAAVVYERALNEDASLVRSIGQLVALAVDRERLIAEVIASHDAQRAAAARLVVAADEERRRIARDLHDGLQGRLVLVALQAGQLASTGDLPSDEAGALGGLHSSLLEAVDELRNLVHGVMPAPLMERGLVAAVEDLADRLPVQADVHSRLDGARLPAGVESSAYFIVAEAVTNAVKHGQPSWIRIELDQPGHTLVVRVTDDGRGGAAVLPGGGLSGIQDRVSTLQGGLRVQSTTAGTRITAEFPIELPGLVELPTLAPHG